MMKYLLNVLTQNLKPSEAVWDFERRKRLEGGRKLNNQFLEADRRFRRGAEAIQQ
jgi:hypothetical protein